MFRVFCLFWLAWLLIEQASLAADLTELPLTKQISLRFATPEEGREAITKRDTFTDHLSKFDLQCRLKTADAVQLEDLLKLYADNVTAWPAEEVAAVTKAAEFVREQLKPFAIAQPKTILLIRTTGREEAGAAYCRGPAIVLPANMIEQDGDALRRLLAHELFHVISTQNPELRRDLYAIIGFRICSPIELPAVLKDRALTNPDAPQIDAYIELKLADGEQLLAAPIL
ncbi:MAG TPA: hypothetical protein VL096_03790, partial [Pirellulaceae bacterium]|nr:hypothetical protein [Pirellulaceae bacterium]